MNVHHQQLSIFDYIQEKENINKLYDFRVTEVDKDLKVLTHSVNVNGEVSHDIIKNSFVVDLSEIEVLDHIENAIEIEVLNYGYTIFYEREQKYYEIYLRFFNNTTSKKETIYEFVSKGFKERA